MTELQILKELQGRTTRVLATPFIPLRDKSPRGVPGGCSPWAQKARTGLLRHAETAAQWLAADRSRHALAVVPGWWNVAVLDLDVNEMGTPLVELDDVCAAHPPAAMISTPSGGTHLVYNKPVRPVKNSLWWWDDEKAGDVRSDLTYVRLYDLAAFLGAVEWCQGHKRARRLPVALCTERTAKPGRKQLRFFGD